MGVGEVYNLWLFLISYTAFFTFLYVFRNLQFSGIKFFLFVERCGINLEFC